MTEENHSESLSGLIRSDVPENYRAGFACIVGRPNVGKSTLTNAMVGQKIAIMSDRPETTRHAVRGIVHRPQGQIVLVDTPGYHRPRTLLGKRLNDMVRENLADVDVIMFCLPSDQKIGPGDEYIAAELKEARAPVIAIATKTDKVSPERLMKHLLDIDQLGDWAEIVPVSGLTGHQVDRLADIVMSHLPVSPPLYPENEITDEPERVMIAELIREAALEGVREELPHSLAVQVEEIIEREPHNAAQRAGKEPVMVDIHVNLFVERDSQKGIIIGAGGKRLRSVGEAARKQISELLGRRVFLDMHVRTAKDWQRDPKMLGRLGF
ncbi:GTPase Era [Boudabousia marimammalium]|uniref:GTPase Era n=1 Tax=Boudabousia marimammalium TaxID=156892 RepID=A0A1Q5PP74_9ACTO|nr:GTPase Era [Boudabousia marimammalium]OKL49316.1 GTPase Era [Boudabousia marimammalium]